MFIRIQSQKKRIRAGEFLGEKAGDEGIVDPPAVCFRSRAIHDPIHFQSSFSAAGSLTIRYFRNFAILRIPDDASSVSVRLSFRLHVRKNVGNFGRKPMAMNLPMGTKMAQESTLFFDRQGLPDFLRPRSKAVDNAS